MARKAKKKPRKRQRIDGAPRAKRTSKKKPRKKQHIDAIPEQVRIREKKRQAKIETASTSSPKKSVKGKKEKKIRKKANPKHYREFLKRKAKERIREGERETRPFLEDISAADFISFMERFYLLVRNKEPEWGWSINQFREEQQWVMITKEKEPDFIKLVEEDFPDLIEEWCFKRYQLKLSHRAANLHAYDQLTVFGQKLLRKSSSDFKRWYSRLFGNSHIEEEKKVQLDRCRMNFEAEHPEDFEDQEAIDFLVERAALEKLKALLLNRLARIETQLDVEKKVWPRDFNWWKNSEQARYANRRFKFLEPMLMALDQSRLTYKQSRDLALEYKIQSPEKRKVWALIDPKQVDTVRRNAGIKSKTFAKYRAALIKCGVLEKVYKIQNGPALLAIGMYSDIGTNRQRVSRFLQGKTVGQIHSFKLGRK